MSMRQSLISRTSSLSMRQWLTMALRALLVVTTISGAVLAAGSVEAVGADANPNTASLASGATLLKTVILGDEAVRESTSLVLLGIGLLGSASVLRRLITKRTQENATEPSHGPRARATWQGPRPLKTATSDSLASST